MPYTVTEINIFPIKSCAGTSVQSASIGATGFENDRRFMVCDADGKFLTQRQSSRMALIKPEMLEHNGGISLRLTAPNMEPFELTAIETGRNIDVEIWGQGCVAVDQGDEVGQWFTSYLEVKTRLVTMDPAFIRTIDEKYRVSEEDQVSFADGYPVLLISQASLDDLNSRLAQPILMNRFRPNIVVDGTAPFEEDTWKCVNIGPVEFSVVKPSSRCVMTTIEQATAQRAVEPLKTLATYRRFEKQILFGENLIHRNTGVIRVGDSLKVLASV
ncbi:MAG TPA: MOSC N-terminal beta barrel domain-containing protein [Planktothrix sp.]|jgi:hypothetical protein